MVTKEMKSLLQQIADLCYLAGEVIFENDETRSILNSCDNLSSQIDELLNSEKEGTD